MDRFSQHPIGRPLPSGFTRRWHAGHWTIAGIAAVEALLVQSGWEQLVRPPAAPNWRLAAAITIVVSTAWLVSVAWCHVRLAEQSFARLGQRRGGGHRWPTLLAALGDLGVAIAALVILRQGHSSPLAVAGAWLLPPALLAAAVPSAALALASGLAARRVSTSLLFDSPSRATCLFALLRAGSLVALLSLLFWLATQGRIGATAAPRITERQKMHHESGN